METENKEDLPVLLDETELSDADDFEETYEEPPSKFERIIQYFETEKGDVTINRIIAIGEKLTPAATKYLETQSEIKKDSLTIEFKKWLWLLIIRFLVVLSALIAAIYLKYTGNLDATTSLIIVTVATVFFSFGRKAES